MEQVKSAARTLDVLEFLAANAGASPGRYSHGELARELAIPKSSLHGILRTLTARGWVETDETGSRFSLGLRALRTGAAYLDVDDTMGLVDRELDELAAITGETVHLGRLDDTDVIYLAKRESTHPLRMYSAIGRRLPAHATALGKALLAERSDAEATALLTGPLARLTPHTLADLPILLADLAATRRRGYATDHEENSLGIACFGIVVRTQSPAIDAISVSVPTVRIEPDTEASVVAALHAAAERIHAARRLIQT